MQEGENGAFLVKPERAARQTESYAVMDDPRRLPRSLQSLLEKR